MSIELVESTSTGLGDRLQSALDAAAQDVTELQTRLDHAKRVHRLLVDLLHYWERAWTLHLKDACERESDFLEMLRVRSHPAVDAITLLYREAQAQADAVIDALPSEIDHRATVEGLALDRSRSRHPRYFFGESGFIEVRVDDPKRTARIGTREGRLTELPADAGAIVSTVQAEIERLFGRKFSGARFLQDLRAAYLGVVSMKHGQDGDPIPIRAVFAEMAKHAKHYRKDEFLVDLSRLVTAGPTHTQGYRFELQQTKDTAEGMLLLGTTGRGMINLLHFQRSSPTP
jgi:hypothetical protein